MSHAKAILCLAIAMLIVSAFLVVAQDRVDVAIHTNDAGTQSPGSPLNAAVGGTNGIGASVDAGPEEQNPYNNIDGVPTFGAFARSGSR